MEGSHRKILLDLRMNIVQDMDIDNDILQPLISEYILKQEDVTYIYIGATKKERAERLLDLLPRYVHVIFDSQLRIPLS